MLTLVDLVAQINVLRQLFLIFSIQKLRFRLFIFTEDFSEELHIYAALLFYILDGYYHTIYYVQLCVTLYTLSE
jgi:hypothetical protein